MRGNKVCKFCGKDGLTWIQIGEKWRLVEESGTLHACQNEGVKLPEELVEQIKAHFAKVYTGKTGTVILEDSKMLAKLKESKLKREFLKEHDRKMKRSIILDD